MPPPKAWTRRWTQAELERLCGSVASDFIQLTVTDSSGKIVFQTGRPGQDNVLSGQATSVTFPPVN